MCYCCELALVPAPSPPSPEKMLFPLQILTFGGSWCLTCYSNKGNVVVNGATKKKEYITGATLKALRVSGDHCELLHVHGALLNFLGGQCLRKH